MEQVHRLQCTSIDEARAYAEASGFTLVVSEELLSQAHQRLGGGMTGSADGAPYSAVGSGTLSQTTANDRIPIEYLDSDGWGEGAFLGINIEDAIEKILDISDVADALSGKPLGPVLVIPTEVLKRWTRQVADEA